MTLKQIYLNNCTELYKSRLIRKKCTNQDNSDVYIQNTFAKHMHIFRCFYICVNICSLHMCLSYIEEYMCMHIYFEFIYAFMCVHSIITKAIHILSGRLWQYHFNKHLYQWILITRKRLEISQISFQISSSHIFFNYVLYNIIIQRPNQEKISNKIQTHIKRQCLLV